MTFAKLLGSTNEVIKAEIDLIRGHLDSNGIEVMTGTASFRDAETVDVVSANATTTVRAEKFLIAVGTGPHRRRALRSTGGALCAAIRCWTWPTCLDR